jgi:hypothetical protein
VCWSTYTREEEEEKKKNQFVGIMNHVYISFEDYSFLSIVILRFGLSVDKR